MLCAGLHPLSLVSSTIEKLLSRPVPLIDPAQQMAQELRAYLTRSDLLRNASLPGRLDMFTTGDVTNTPAGPSGGAGPGNSVSYYPPCPWTDHTKERGIILWKI